MLMSSNEYNMNVGIDHSRTHSSQTRQHFFGYWRSMKRQALHFSRFGLYIGLIEIPMEMIVGK